MMALSILNAGPVVQGVIVTLLLGSVASWAIIIHKLFAFRTFGRVVRQVETFAALGSAAQPVSSRLVTDLLAARDGEPDLTGAESRVARGLAMRQVAVDAVRQHEGGLPFLATLAATAPFIGLFGTVWGIMRSFAAIADTNDTSLAVVAPGIAEALFATAIGLAAAIPAVIAFNLLRATLRRYGHRLATAIALLAKPQPAEGQSP